MNVKKRKLAITLTVLTGTVVLADCASERSPITGVIGRSNKLAVGHSTPDFPIVTTDGQETSFEKVRKKVAIVAFGSPKGAQCCWLNPDLLSLADKLRDRPITVAQISEPTEKCSHGPGCIATCNLEDSHIVSLCDADRIAWRAFQEPEPNTVLLVDYRGKATKVAQLADLRIVATKARQLADDVEGRWQSACDNGGVFGPLFGDGTLVTGSAVSRLRAPLRPNWVQHRKTPTRPKLLPDNQDVFLKNSLRELWCCGRTFLIIASKYSWIQEYRGNLLVTPASTGGGDDQRLTGPC